MLATHLSKFVRKKLCKVAEANPHGEAAKQLKARRDADAARHEKKRKAALADPESDIAKMKQKMEECKELELLEQAQVFASLEERIWRVAGVHAPCVLRKWQPLVRLGEASSTLATAIGYAGHQCHEERIFNGTGKHMRGCIYSRGGRLPQLLAVINAMAEDDIPVPVKGSLYGTVSAYLALCAI